MNCFVFKQLYLHYTQKSHSVEWGHQSNIANCIGVVTRPLMMISRWSWKLLIAGCRLGFAGKPKNQQQNPTQARQKTSKPHTATFHTSNSGAQCNGCHRLWEWDISVVTFQDQSRGSAFQGGTGGGGVMDERPNSPFRLRGEERLFCQAEQTVFIVKLATAIYQVWKWP